ncbi:protein associated with UVRAG as autophagy enhancer isoform X2 [Kryptolebias marmoratus]|uniref:protein associated with UVRAG as autophagy enhancer isoform X2 n=1 Tax=Kryptolebias marmoratus TaxID=37003 RepID=UPI0018ACD541|nr:protein associated with UVRAG as autophagy enhancer isoform X2 [Kryptolebias marmoratus]
MMGTNFEVSPSSNRCQHVSWCVGPTESQDPAVAALTGSATPQKFSHQNQHLAGSGSLPPAIMSQSETSREEKDATFPHQCPRAPFIKRRRHKALRNSHQCSWSAFSSSTSHNSKKDSNIHSVEGEDDDIGLTNQDGSFRHLKADSPNKKEASLHSEDENFLLPRSSPVISRCSKPIAWNNEGTNTSNPSSTDSSCLSSGPLSLGQHENLLSSKSSSHQQPVPSAVDDMQQSVSLLSNLNSLLSSHHLPHKAPQQGTDRGHREKSLNSYNTPLASDLSASTCNKKERSCSGILDFSADIFRTSCELEKENAHFIVVDLVLEVLEGAKCTLGFNHWTSTMDKHQDTHCKMRTKKQRCSAEDTPPHRQACGIHKHMHSDKVTRTHSCSWCENDGEPASYESDHQKKSLSFLSTDSGFEDCGFSTVLTPTDSLRNAEWLAQQLVLEFKKKWLPSQVLQRGRQSLRSSLQELPGTEGVEVSSGSLSEEIRLRTRMRGTLNWAPPRFQIVFSIQPPQRRSEVVALQHYLCAGCGTEVEPRYIKKLRYCDYLGRYFCDCCHSSSDAVIPGRVLSCWDFSRYSVSDFSKQLLDSVWYQPLFDLTCVGKTLYGRVKELDRFRELQEQLLEMRKLLKACRLSKRVLAELEQLPAHLMEQPLLFSMEDLLKAKKGQLVAPARALLHSAMEHVKNCECARPAFTNTVSWKKSVRNAHGSDHEQNSRCNYEEFHVKICSVASPNFISPFL